MNPDDTIVAVGSASGFAARMVVRTSGPRATEAALALAPDLSDLPGSAARATLRFAGLTCPAWVYVFRGPRSYTGDDSVEYHLPGNPVLAELLLCHLRAAGLRPAEAGEFTARAYFNGRLDLTQAEGVAATIAAGSARELAAARGLMAGELARRLTAPADALLDTLALVELGIDFADEDVTVLPPAELLVRVEECRAQLRAVLADTGRFRRLSHEPTFVLAGRPNAGKSTLLNALAGYDRAVASPAAGTTRDAVSADVPLARGFVRVVDVAGLGADEPAVAGDGGSPSAAPFAVAKRMREQAERAIAEADFVLLLTPCDEPHETPDVGRTPDLVVSTKADLAGLSTGSGTGVKPDGRSTSTRPVRVSAATGSGLDELRTALDELAFGRGGTDSRLALNARHVEAIGRAIAGLDRAGQLAATGGPAELVSAELRDAVEAIGGVLGRVSPDVLLGRIFSQFCIGK